jgi:hypothetical protein
MQKSIAFTTIFCEKSATFITICKKNTKKYYSINLKIINYIKRNT